MTAPHRVFNFALPLATVAWLTAPAGLVAQACDGVRADRMAVILGGYAVAEAGAIALRHGDWWTTPTTSFHFDAQVSPSASQDKLLHATIGYQTSQVGRLAWRWACVRDPAAAWLGAALGVAIALPKEIGDGLHEGKGFDAPDMAWTAGGALLPALHAIVPPSRVLQLKVNYWPSRELRERTGNLPQLENDYAGQRYFLAIDPGLLSDGAGPWPDWLGIALGHSVQHWITAVPVHEWFVTLDLNLRGLPIQAPWWHRVASVLDQIHVPLPGVRFRAGGARVGAW